MVLKRSGPSTEGSTTFDADAFFGAWAASPGIQNDDLAGLIRNSFGLKHNDTYVYHAIASVTLAQVQRAIGFGAANRMHAWYLDADGKQIPNPPQVDVTAYTSIFSPTTSTSKALTALAANAKKSSLRAGVAANLLANRVFPAEYTITKNKNHINPYLDLWTWSCHNLEWAGPNVSTVNVKQSHHILPIFYHHFGCVCPSYESLETIKQATRGRTVLDIGSGNGYWTLMLRRIGVKVTGVDNGDSLWRTLWIGDTVRMDGSTYLAQTGNGADAVLLLVYPQVSGNFTTNVLEKYQGDTVCVAGTQNQNGFTAFGDITIDRYFEKNMHGWKKTVQTPLPSFAGKDEALFVFRREDAG